MALIFTEGFEHGINASIDSGKWGVGSDTSSVSLQTGRQTGRLAWASTSSSRYVYSKIFPIADRDDVIVTGAAFKFSSVGAYPFSLRGDAGVTEHVTMYHASASDVRVYLGTTSGTLLGTLAHTFVTGTWYYVEMKVKLHDTLGEVHVRVDGATVLSLTGIDTKNAGTAAVLDQVRVGAGMNTAVDDWYICNEQGTEFNDFLGDVRIETLAPSGDGGTLDWTARNQNRMPNVNMSGIETDASQWEVDSNCTIARVTTPVHSGTGALAVTSVAAGNMSVRTLGGTSGIPVLASTYHAFTAYVRTALNARMVAVGVNWFDSAGTFISTQAFSNTSNDTTSYALRGPAFLPPGNAAFAQMIVQWQATAAGGEIHYLDAASVMETSSAIGTTTDPVTTPTHWTAVRSPGITAALEHDYVIGDSGADLWTHEDSTLPPGSPIKAVMQWAVARMDTPTVGKIAMRSALGASSLTSEDVDVPQSYSHIGKAWSTDPDGAAWTPATVNAAEFGVKIPSAVAFRAVSTKQIITGSSNITIPAETEVGDMMIMAICEGYSDVINKPAGWTVLGSLSAGGYRGDAYSRVAQAGDAGATVPFSVASGSVRWNAVIAVYGGASAALAASVFSSGSGTTVTAPTATAVAPGSMAVRIFRGRNTLSALPATERALLNNYTGTLVTLGLSDAGVEVGATGTAAATQGPTDSWSSATIVLSPS